MVVRRAAARPHLFARRRCAASVEITRVSFGAADTVTFGESTDTRSGQGAPLEVTGTGAVADASTRIVIATGRAVTLRRTAGALVAALSLGATRFAAFGEGALALQGLVADLMVAALGAVEGAVAAVVGGPALGAELLARRRLTRGQTDEVTTFDLETLPVQRTRVVTDLGADGAFQVVDAVLTVAFVVLVTGPPELALAGAEVFETHLVVIAGGLARARCGLVVRRVGRWIDLVVGRVFLGLGDRVNSPVTVVGLVGDGRVGELRIGPVFTAGRQGQGGCKHNEREHFWQSE